MKWKVWHDWMQWSLDGGAGGSGAGAGGQAGGQGGGQPGAGAGAGGATAAGSQGGDGAGGNAPGGGNEGVSNGGSQPGAGDGGAPANGGAGDGAAAGDPPALPDNWRDHFAGDDADLKKFLAESASPQDFAKRVRGLRQAMSKQATTPQRPAALAENATDAQKADHAKAMEAYYEATGLPKTVEAYVESVTPPDFLNTDEGKAQLAKDMEPYAKLAHDAGIDPATFGKLAALRFDEMAGQQQRQAQADAQGRQMIETALVGEGYTPADVDQGLRAIDGMGVSLMGEQQWDALLSLRMANGQRFGDSADFFKAFIQPARDTFGETLSLTTDVSSVENAKAEYDALMTEFRETPSSNWPAEKQARLDALSRRMQVGGQQRGGQQNARPQGRVFIG